MLITGNYDSKVKDFQKRKSPGNFSRPTSRAILIFKVQLPEVNMNCSFKTCYSNPQK